MISGWSLEAPKLRQIEIMNNSVMSNPFCLQLLASHVFSLATLWIWGKLHISTTEKKEKRPCEHCIAWIKNKWILFLQLGCMDVHQGEPWVPLNDRQTVVYKLIFAHFSRKRSCEYDQVLRGFRDVHFCRRASWVCALFICAPYENSFTIAMSCFPCLWSGKNNTEHTELLWGIN